MQTNAATHRRADFQQQLGQRRSELRPGGGELRRGHARRAAAHFRFAAGVVRVRGGQRRRRRRRRRAVARATPSCRRARPRTSSPWARWSSSATSPTSSRRLSDGQTNQSRLLAAADGFRQPGGVLFLARQRGHRHGRQQRTVQAGRGFAGNLCGLDPINSITVGHQCVLQPDKRVDDELYLPGGGYQRAGLLQRRGPAECGGGEHNHLSQPAFAESISGEPADLRAATEFSDHEQL